MPMLTLLFCTTFKFGFNSERVTPAATAETDGTTHIVVSIRGICWEGNQISLPSGCGIVGGSAFDHEWRELRLKREAVLRLLALQS